MQCQKVDYAIIGEDMQSLEVTLAPGETIIGEAGTVNFLNDAIRMEARSGTGAVVDEGLWSRLAHAGKRLLTGESLFFTHFTNTADGQRRVSFSAPCPGKVFPLDMSELEEEILCQREVFLGAARGTQISLAFARRLGAGFFSGDGFVLHRLQGDGLVFLHAGGTMVKKELKNEVLLADTGCIAAFTTGIDYSIQRSGGLKSLFAGGKGLFLATLRGTGTVFLQTLPVSRLADRMLSSISGGREKG